MPNYNNSALPRRNLWKNSMTTTKIHPTAVVDPSARLADDVEIGPHAIVEADVEIGAGTVLRPHSIVRRFTTMGANNYVDSFVVLGGEPQDYKFDSKLETFLRIGENNTFREGVTISRATTLGQATTVGNETYWMANSHAGHDCEIHDNVILANGCNLAGHCTIGRGSILPANGNTHQFVWIGEMVMCQGGAQMGMHVPPFVICAQDNNVVTLNAIGLRRSPEISDEDRKQIKEAFALTYRSSLTPTRALEKMDACTDWGRAAGKFRQFIHDALAAEPPFKRGLCPHLSRIGSRR